MADDKKVQINIVVTSNLADLKKIEKALGNVGKSATKSNKETKESLKAITPALQELWQQTEKVSQHWKTSFSQALPLVKKLGKGFKFASDDTLKLAQAAQSVATKFNVSFKQSYNSLKRFGVGSKIATSEVDKIASAAVRFSKKWGVSYQSALQYQLRLTSEVSKGSNTMRKSLKGISSDTDKVAKRARAFAQAWGVSFKEAYAFQSKLGTGVKSTTKNIDKSFDGTGNKLTILAWHFRYLGTVFTRVSKQLIRMAKDWFTVATDIEESFFSIRAATALYGQDTDAATEMAQKLAETGLVPLTAAADSLRNLLLTGIGLPEIERLTYRYLDVASLATSGAKGLQQSFETITASIVRGSLVLSKDVAARGIWNQTNKRLQESTGILLKDLNAQQRAMEILTTIEEDFMGTEGLHRIEMLQMGATIGRLDTAYQALKRTLASALRPALEFITKQFISFVKTVSKVIDAMGKPFVGILGLITLSFITLSGALLTFTALLISSIKIWKIASFQLTVLSMKMVALTVSTNSNTLALFASVAAWIAVKLVTWEFWVILGAIAAAIGVVTWLVLKLKGTFSETAQKIEATENELGKMTKALAESGEEFKGFSNNVENTLEKISELEKGISDKRKSYERDLAQLVRKHSDSWHKAAKDVEEAKVKMQESLADFTKSHKESVEDESFAYKRRREDLEEEIAREVAKGLWADQMKIKSLNKTLKRLDEDHQRAVNKENGRYEDRKKSVMETYHDELKTAEETISKIAVLWAKHDEAVREGIKLMATLPDEYEAIKESFVENTKEEQKELDVLNVKIDDMKKKIIELYEPLKNLGKIFFEALIDPLGTLTINAPTVLGNLKEGFIDLFNVIVGGASESKTKLGEIQDEMLDIAGIFPDLTTQSYGMSTPARYSQSGDTGSGIREQLKSIWESPFWSFPKFQTGGIVPGMRNQPIPILAHGGERVTPAGETTNMGGVSININNPIVRSEKDIKDIASQVSKVLGQRQRWGALGAY